MHNVENRRSFNMMDGFLFAESFSLLLYVNFNVARWCEG